MVCFYFVWTILTTVGFGDIYATNTKEAIFCVFLFITSATVFAFLVAQINEIISAIQADTKELEDYLDAYLAVRPRLGTGTLLSIRAFERYSFQEDQLIRQSQSVLARKSLPEHLRVAVAKRLEDNLFSKVFFLQDLHAISNIRSLFAAEVCVIWCWLTFSCCSPVAFGQMLIRSTTRYFSEKSVIVDTHDEADGLMVVNSGQVRFS
mmetsp:Transcript_37950/g.101000  ORF Transcript_37950/g.101000 Transcript_37950/m.101000 type:complete len:207 (+) Transcript_37950:1610-2230(+)